MECSPPFPAVLWLWMFVKENPDAKKKCKNILFMQILLVSSNGMLVNNEAKYKLAITILLTWIKISCTKVTEL